MPREEKNKIINNIKATMAIENQKLNDNDIQLLEDFADDKISMEEAMNLIKNMILRKV